MKNQDEQTTCFEYENNKKVSSIERRYLDFDYNQDTDVFEITVHFRDGNIFSGHQEWSAVTEMAYLLIQTLNIYLDVPFKGCIVAI